MQSFLLTKKKKITFLEGIQTLSISTQNSYKAVLNHFDSFCYEKYNKRSTQNIIDELHSLPPEKMEIGFIGSIQDFIYYMEKLDLAPNTIYNHYQVMTYFFGHNGIRMYHADLRRRIKFPKILKKKLHPLTIQEIHKLFEFTPQKRQMLYLVLIGAGTRIRETTCLRKKDFDLNYPKRIKMDIPAQFTKTQTAHTTFVSREAAKLLRPHLKSLEDEDLVFSTNYWNPANAGMTEIEAFGRYRDRAGLGEKYETVNRHLITLHSFRSYFVTRARRVHDSDIANAMVGHLPTFDMYDRKDDDEKLEMYLKVEPKLKIF